MRCDSRRLAPWGGWVVGEGGGGVAACGGVWQGGLRGRARGRAAGVIGGGGSLRARAPRPCRPRAARLGTHRVVLQRHVGRALRQRSDAFDLGGGRGARGESACVIVQHPAACIASPPPALPDTACLPLGPPALTAAPAPSLPLSLTPPFARPAARLVEELRADVRLEAVVQQNAQQLAVIDQRREGVAGGGGGGPAGGARARGWAGAGRLRQTALEAGAREAARSTPEAAHRRGAPGLLPPAPHPPWAPQRAAHSSAKW
jgi:hypothetical protein